MKNKGFTLIELIAIIIILAAITLLSIPAVINMQKESEENKKQTALKSLYLATESYILSDYDDKYNQPIFSIYVNKLIENGYVKSDSINPLTEEIYTEYDYVYVTRNENNEFLFELKVRGKSYLIPDLYNSDLYADYSVWDLTKEIYFVDYIDESQDLYPLSEDDDGSIMGWAIENDDGYYNIYIGSYDTIYAKRKYL